MILDDLTHKPNINFETTIKPILNDLQQANHTHLHHFLQRLLQDLVACFISSGLIS